MQSTPASFGRGAFMFMVAGVSLAAAERLDRGVVAFPSGDGGVYVGWRLLLADAKDVAFDVFRAESGDGPWTQSNARPIEDSTNFVDRTAQSAGRRFYAVKRAGERGKIAAVEAVEVAERAETGGRWRFKLARGAGAAKVGVGDFDGDGKLDYLVRTPDVNVDPFYRLGSDGKVAEGNWKPSPETMKLEAYRHDGTLLWRHDLGWAIETGTWYAPVVVYDVDGDGRAEVYCKGGPPGDPRDEHGRVTGGPEYLLKLDGLTGQEVARVDWPSRDGYTARKGNEAIPPYNQYSRNIIAIAYLDGKRPHVVVQRGKYTQIKLRAYDPALKLAWQLDINERNHPTFMGSGMHGMQVADIDGDGRDELIVGACAIDDDGKPLWTTRRGHPDACYVGDLDPTRPGLEIYYHQEWPMARDGVGMVDARTGRPLWGYAGPTTHVHSTGLVADIDPTRPGLESYGGESNSSQFFLYDARGTRIGNRSLGGLSPEAVYWDATTTKAVVSEGLVFRLKPPPAGVNFDASANASVGDVVRDVRGGAAAGKIGGSKSALWPGYVGATFGEIEGTVMFVGDILGDWREEIVTATRDELRIYSTTVPATTRRVTLLQDRKYRTSVGMFAMGYFFVPIEGGTPVPVD
ncbi:MAG TPA: hypothetical protein VM029_03310 [Opitutaceae bacterium]|nr:hypothetical protein [Opitutaceae bacterium]